jgi:replicative DNA helicase
LHHLPTSEDRLLGAILVGLTKSPNDVEPWVSLLLPRHFALEANRIIFEAIGALRQKGSSVDLVAVYGQLRWRGQTIAAGGSLHLFDLWESACHPSEVPALATELIQWETLSTQTPGEPSALRSMPTT